MVAVNACLHHLIEAIKLASADRLAYAYLADVPFAAPSYPVVANVDARMVRDAATARDTLVRQLTAPVRWTACVRAMREAGVNRFLELGPGKVLTGLLRRIDRDAEGTPLGTADDLERFLAA